MMRKIVRRGMYSMKEGFSLIEVIIAVALLALMALPILAYFTNAAVTTSRGKNAQKAIMAAETLAEQMNSFDTLEALEEYLQTESATDTKWTISRAESGIGGSGQSTTTILTREGVEVDGTSYNVKVTLEYDYPESDSVSGYKSPNKDAIPELKEVYSSENAVVAEGDQLDRAVSHFLMNHPDHTQAGITAGLTRELRLDITELNGIYTVTGSYYYTYNYTEGGSSGTDSYETIITRTKVEDLANAYFFFKPVTPSGEQVRVSAVTNSSEESVKQKFRDHMDGLHLYFVCQNTTAPDIVPDPGYYLSFDLQGEAGRAIYHTNLNTITPGIPDSHKQDLVTSSTKMRIAKVSIDVYGTEDTSMSDSLAHLESSKGE